MQLVSEPLFGHGTTPDNAIHSQLMRHLINLKYSMQARLLLEHSVQRCRMSVVINVTVTILFSRCSSLTATIEFDNVTQQENGSTNILEYADISNRKDPKQWTVCGLAVS